MSLFTEIALRALLRLHTQPDTAMTIRDLAHVEKISYDHLAKVAATLSAAGYIESQRGRGGGIRIRGSAQDICLGAVVRVCARACWPPELQQQARSHGYSDFSTIFDRARQAYFLELDKYTVADLAHEVSPKVVWDDLLICSRLLTQAQPYADEVHNESQ